MAPGPRINFGQYEFPKKMFLWNCLLYSDWTLGSFCTCDIIIIKQLASLTGIKSVIQLFSRFGSSLVTRVDNDSTWWIDKTLWMPWQGHYLVTRHLGRKKQGRQVCRRCRDAGNLRCASGMQRCTDADMQGGVFFIVFGGYPGLLCKLFCKLMKRPSLMQQILMSRCNTAEPSRLFLCFQFISACPTNINIDIYNNRNVSILAILYYWQAKSLC